MSEPRFTTDDMASELGQRLGDAMRRAFNPPMTEARARKGLIAARAEIKSYVWQAEQQRAEMVQAQADRDAAKSDAWRDMCRARATAYRLKTEASLRQVAVWREKETEALAFLAGLQQIAAE